MPRCQYQVIEFNFSRGSTFYSVEKMNSYLNEQAEEGWRVVGITSVPEDDYIKPLIVVLEKEG